MSEFIIEGCMNYADEYAEHIKKFSCNHDQKRIVRQVVGGGAVQYVYQCIKCGARVSNAMSKAAAIQLVGGDPVDFDDALKDRWESDRKRDLSDIEQRKKQKTTAFFEWYGKYLETPEWKERRELVLKRDNHLCQGCLSAPATVVHHKNYDHVGGELLFDLVSLCEPCHEKAHKPRDT